MRFDPKVKPEAFASKDWTRPHLTRVQLDAEAKALVATDGHRMIVTPVTDCDADHSGPIDGATLAAARKVKVNGGCELSANGCVKLSDGTTYVRPTDCGEFPRWQAAIPSGEDDVRARIAIDSEYLASVFKALGKRQVDITIRGELDPIEFRAQTELGETIIVIMPMRR